MAMLKLVHGAMALLGCGRLAPGMYGTMGSASVVASFLNAFFSIFFSKYVRASTLHGRGGRPAVHARMNNEIADHNYEINDTIISELR